MHDQSGIIYDSEYGQPGTINNHKWSSVKPLIVQSEIINGTEYGQPGTINLYDPEYDQPVFAWEGNPGKKGVGNELNN